MTNSGSSPEPKKGFKVTLAQGVIGAVSLAGTTAIPLLVQKYVGVLPAPSTSPTAVSSPQASPTPASSAVPVAPSASPQVELTPTEASVVQPAHPEDEHLDPPGKGKKKGKKHD